MDRTDNKNNPEILLGMTRGELVTHLFDAAICVSVWIAMANDQENTYRETFGNILRSMIFYAIVHLVWYSTDVHKRWGPWKTSEPPQHMKFALQTTWIVGLGSMGLYASRRILQMRYAGMGGWGMKVLIKLTPEQMGPFAFLLAPEQPTTLQNVIMGIVIFYVMDFCRYWSHRTGHHDFFFKTFPMSHAHHHNQIFVNPVHLIVSPLGNLEIWSNAVPCCLFAYLGWADAASGAWMFSQMPNWTQHLGFDPLPWLTRINHYYFYGSLPWIPHYHAYHHLNIIRPGNYSNLTQLWDYVFDTLQEESVYHIEHGEPKPFIKSFFANPKLGSKLEQYYVVGRRNRLDLNY